MTKHLTLLLFIGLAWGQDEYPYFKDMNKQLKFEQKRIYIAYDNGYKITRNGKIISELNFLYTLGLKEQADSLSEVYNKELKDYLSPNQVNMKLDKANYYAKKYLYYIASSLFGVVAIVMISDEYLKPVSILPGGLSIAAGLTGIFTKKENYMIKIERKKRLPILEEFFTQVQIQSMAEAYNRKLFDDISR